MAVERPVGDVASGGPANPEQDPPSSDHARTTPETTTAAANNQAPTSQYQPNNDYQQPNWRQRFHNIYRGFPPADFWLALFTLVLVVETYWTIQVLTATDLALHETAKATTASAATAERLRELSEATTRAWIGPQNLLSDSHIAINQPLKMTLNYHNTGREPALDVARRITFLVFKDFEQQSGKISDWSETQAESCKALTPKVGDGTIYPTTGFSSYNLNFEIPKDSIDWDIIYGSSVIVVSGCLAYKTGRSPHRSSFCYFYQNGVSAPQGWSICGSGNYAE